MTSLSSIILSKVQPLWALDISCFIAVRNPWGLKKPVIQKWEGFSLNIQEVIWLCRFSNSLNQKPIVDDNQDALIQIAGIRPSYKKSNVSLKICKRETIIIFYHNIYMLNFSPFLVKFFNFCFLYFSRVYNYMTIHHYNIRRYFPQFTPSFHFTK